MSLNQLNDGESRLRRTPGEETILTEDSHGIDEEENDIENTAKSRHDGESRAVPNKWLQDLNIV